jgi:8-oxo-dGTP pyrophosphatase MutT (NUDIX family)
MNQVVTKVAAYITCDQKLLVFSHADFPKAGIQIPAGTVGQDENLNEAVLREAFEETGLSDLNIESYLGVKVYDLRSIDGREIDVHRHYYHLSIPGPIDADRWQHWEMSPSEGPKDPILFELYWVKIPDEIPELTSELGDMLDKLILNQ